MPSLFYVPYEVKLVLIVGNCPPLLKSEIEYYVVLSKTTVHHFAGALDTPAGKLFPRWVRAKLFSYRYESILIRKRRYNVITITNPGESDLLCVAERQHKTVMCHVFVSFVCSPAFPMIRHYDTAPIVKNLHF
jgi:hypothetical protein